MIREARDPDWWRALASSPDVVEAMPDIDPDFVAAAVLDPVITPWASQNGGLLFARTDAIGLVQDMHAIFRSEGRGREANAAMKAAIAAMFERGARTITVTQTQSPMSRPPLSYGFRIAPHRRPTTQATEAGAVAIWVLTIDAWRRSPVHRRH